ncbi:5-dehydro-2-deoxygluconokinase [Actinacidiphila bryophytorum]|uniref:5-dehydro-2-deoxygluconokinase n=1 Tax=Actinacidiphila bryophytorum TaxID=1436133 RepID=UPI002176C30C|nr:5-dehydro-2-deoxygluconokinase [Actinacidiphila bryophytorum]UWE11543.1 5-dehydro-2-deoxygluconokinase [Actinacidiphila bryophytorum]
MRTSREEDAEPAPAQGPYDVVTLGRVGVDLYPQQSGVGLADVHTFAKYLGGTAANVAVAAARLGLRTAVLSAVAPDPFGTFVRTALTGFGVDPALVHTIPGTQTPVVFCELFPPDDFPIHFYRRPVAPDECLTPDLLDVPATSAAVRTARALWITGSALAVEPTRSTVFAALERRAGGEVWFDLDWRPGFWADPAEAPALYARALSYATVAVGNRAEVEVAVGTADPESAAGELLRRGVRTAVVKQGPAGALVRTAREQYVAPPMPVKVVNGLGAGDAFGGALCAGLLAADPLPQVLRAANAAGAIVASRLACADAMPTRAEIEAALREQRAPRPPDAEAVPAENDALHEQPAAGGGAAARRPPDATTAAPDTPAPGGTGTPHPGVDQV